jgi:hypothetical protein
VGVSDAQLREQIVGTVASTGTRAIAFGDGGLGFVQRTDVVTFTESLGANVTAGRTIGSSFTRGTLSATLGASGSRIPLPISAAATYGRMTTGAPLFEQFALGGGPPVVFDRVLIAQRWSMPVLPAETAVGASAFAYRVNVAVSPVVWYWWAAATALPGDPFTEWHRVAGVEWSEAVSAIVPAGTPAARGAIGVGESIDMPFRRKVRAYVSLVINP